MDAVYDQMHDHAKELQFSFHDAVDDANHPQIRSIQHEIHGLVEDFESEKDLRHLDNRLKNLEHSFEELRTHGDALVSFRDMERMQHEFRSMRVKVRSHPHY